MIVVAKTDAEKWAMFRFLHAHGVQVQKSDDFQAIGRVGTGGSLIGVVAYNGFCGNTCAMHIAGDGNWVSREYIKAAFDYPFNQLGIEAVIAPVAADNHKALRFDKHFGFQEVHRVKNGWEKGTDLIYLQLLRKDCRWLQAGVPVLRAA